MAKLGVVAGEHDVAMAGQLGCTGQAIPVHLRDNRLGERPQALPTINHFLQAYTIAGYRKARSRLLSWLEVIASAKCTAGASNDQNAGRWIVFELVQRTV